MVSWPVLTDQKKSCTLHPNTHNKYKTGNWKCKRYIYVFPSKLFIVIGDKLNMLALIVSSIGILTPAESDQPLKQKQYFITIYEYNGKFVY